MIVFNAYELLHVAKVCDPSTLARAVPAFTCHQPALRFTGQNLVWVAGIQIRHGVLLGDKALVSQGFVLIGREVRVLPREEGLQPDMSFFQHGLVLYSGGYGQGFAGDVARFVWLADGTPYAWPEAKVSLLVRYVLDGCRWLVRGRTFDYGAIGREITRCGHSAERVLHGAAYLAQIDTPRRAELQAFAAGGAGRSFVEGNRFFWCADLMAHHRSGYAVTVRMPSTRIENADWPCCGGEGRLCHHMAEGATFLYRDGDEYRDLFPVWNWRQIPGTTVEQRDGPLDPEGLRGFGEHAFAGGVSDGRVGCAAVDFSRKTLRARKAWFLFDAGLVALGAGIASTADAPVLTTVNQSHRRGRVLLNGEVLGEGVHPLKPGVVLSHDGRTYAILAGARGEVRLERRAGSWADCGVGSDARHEQSVFTVGIGHGVRPVDGAYAYAVLPDPAAGGAVTDGFAVLCNDTEMQAVWCAAEGRGQAVFYAAGGVRFPDGQEVAADRPCLLLYRREGGRAVLTVADPRQQEPRLALTLRGPVAATVAVSLPQGEYAGSSLSLTVA